MMKITMNATTPIMMNHSRELPSAAVRAEEPTFKWVVLRQSAWTSRRRESMVLIIKINKFYGLTAPNYSK